MEDKNEISTELGLDDLDGKVYGREHKRWLQSLPELLKLLLISSWICAALTAFVSVYFAVPGVIAAYAANRTIPGIGRAAMITNIVLGVLNILLSIAFLATVRNIFTIL